MFITTVPPGNKSTKESRAQKKLIADVFFVQRDGAALSSQRAEAILNAMCFETLVLRRSGITRMGEIAETLNRRDLRLPNSFVWTADLLKRMLFFCTSGQKSDLRRIMLLKTRKADLDLLASRKRE